MRTIYVGVDYSGRGHCRTRTAGIQVYWSTDGDDPRRVSPSDARPAIRNWHREGVYQWLLELLQGEDRVLVGMDHAFSFPFSYFQRHQLPDWESLLRRLHARWPTDRAEVRVDDCRRENGDGGAATEMRRTELWTSGVKGVFHFDVQGSVAKSTHAGLPWLRRLRDQLGDRLHVWPFDGWEPPPDRSVIAEVFPSLVRRRYPREKRNADQQDAYAVARWLSESDRGGHLIDYFTPPLDDRELQLAAVEGWILGVR